MNTRNWIEWVWVYEYYYQTALLYSRRRRRRRLFIVIAFTFNCKSSSHCLTLSLCPSPSYSVCLSLAPACCHSYLTTIVYRPLIGPAVRCDKWMSLISVDANASYAYQLRAKCCQASPTFVACGSVACLSPTPTPTPTLIPRSSSVPCHLLCIVNALTLDSALALIVY